MQDMLNTRRPMQERGGQNNRYTVATTRGAAYELQSQNLMYTIKNQLDEKLRVRRSI